VSNDERRRRGRWSGWLDGVSQGMREREEGRGRVEKERKGIAEGKRRRKVGVRAEEV
jgi:hypothetical protein